jgi:hypothetical protein
MVGLFHLACQTGALVRREVKLRHDWRGSGRVEGCEVVGRYALMGSGGGGDMRGRIRGTSTLIQSFTVYMYCS